MGLRYSLLAKRPDRGEEARREMSMRTPFEFGTIRCVLLLPAALALFLPVLFHSAFAQQQLAPGARAPTSQTPAPLAGAPPLVPAPAATSTGAATPPGAIPPTAGAMPPVPVDWGLCQCIGDKQSLDFTCPGSADACQAACGKLFSYKPDARCRPATTTQ
jgi:hypothetical protein